MAQLDFHEPRDISVRIQIVTHGTTHDKRAEAIKKFRLRLPGKATFTDLASTALARFAREAPERGAQTRVESILDEEDCAVDFDERIDLISPGELLKVVLVPGQECLTKSMPATQISATRAASANSSQTPAVKNIRPRTPATLHSSVSTCSKSGPRALGANSHSKVVPSTPADAIQSTAASAIDVSIRGTGHKKDPYEIPSDSEVGNTRKPQKTGLRVTDPRVLVPTQHVVSNPAMVTAMQLAQNHSIRSSQQGPARISKQAIPTDAKVISVSDSSSSSGGNGGPASSCGKPMEIQTTNNHQKAVEGKQDEILEASETRYADEGTSSWVVVPIGRAGRAPAGSGAKGEAASASTTYLSQSANDVQSTGSLTLKPSQIAGSVRNLMARFQREAQERESEKTKTCYQEAARKAAQAETKRNQSDSAIAHLRRITNPKFSRKGKISKRSIPASFFEEPAPSDEDLSEIMIGVKPPAHGPLQHDRGRATPATTGIKRSDSRTRAISPLAKFKGLNTLSESQRPVPPPKPLKKFGAAYSQQVRAAFSDIEDTSSSEQEQSGIATMSRTMPTDDWNQEDQVNQEKAFLRWADIYETTYTTQSQCYAVADGPFRGLIRQGRRQGTYLPGYGPPTHEEIHRMELTAKRIDKSDSGPESCLRPATSNPTIGHKVKKGGEESEAQAEAAAEEEEEEVEEAELPVTAQESHNAVSTGADAMSVLIMKELPHENPPSNQELGILMSSSPARTAATSTQTPGPRRSKRLAATAAMNSEHMQRVPGPTAHELSRMSLQKGETPKRDARAHNYDTDLDVTPSFEKALSQVETPSTKSRCMEDSPIKALRFKDGYVQTVGRSKIVVKIPDMPADKQAQYLKVPEVASEDSGHALRSFDDINCNHGVQPDSSVDSGAAAIEHVLKASAAWLAGPLSVDCDFPQTRKAASCAAGKQFGSTGRNIVLSDHQKCKPDETAGRHANRGVPGPQIKPDISGVYKSSSSSKANRIHAEPNRREVSQQQGLAEYNNRPVIVASVSQDKSLPSSARKGSGISGVGPSLISMTPIPAPSIAEMLQKIKATPQHGEPPVASGMQSVSRVSKLSGLGKITPVPTMITEPVPANVSFLRPSVAQFPAVDRTNAKTRSTGGKRKRLDAELAVDGQSASQRGNKRWKKNQHHANNAPGHVEHKEQMMKEPGTKNAARQLARPGGAPYDGSSNIGATVNLNGPLQNPASVYPAKDAITAKAQHVTTAAAAMQPNRGKKSRAAAAAIIAKKRKKQFKRRERRRRKRQQQRAEKVSTHHDADEPLRADIPKAERAATLIPEAEKTALPSKMLDSKHRGHNQHFILLPPLAQAETRNHSTAGAAAVSAGPKARATRLNEAVSSRHRLKSTREDFLTPPTTSRPSSAGSGM